MKMAGITSDFTFAHDAMLALGRALREQQYRFVTPTPATLARVNRRPDNRHATTATDVFGWNRPFHDWPLTPALERAALDAGVVVSGAHPGERRAAVRFSTLGDDLYAHSPFPTEAPESVFFGPDSYRFALAIEREVGLRPWPVRQAVDIGCGAGPGALTLARVCPSARVVAVDINDNALAFCALNRQLAGRGNIDIHRGDLFASLQGTFDFIVANPPYLQDAGERIYRHGGGRYGEALSVRIVEQSLDRLARGGRLLLYTGVAIGGGRDPFLEQVAPLLDRHGYRWEYTEIDPDVFGEELARPAYADIDRIAVVVLTVIAVTR